MRWLIHLVLGISPFLVARAQSMVAAPEVLRDTMLLLDTVRQRTIPIAIYTPSGASAIGMPVILFSHGYNENKPGTYLLYRWLLEPLAKEGFVVVSVQHELPTDEPLAMRGNIAELRRPGWERGAANLDHVLRRLLRTRPHLDQARITVMGHSQGGDISVLYAMIHPDRVQKLITMDNRRLTLPRTTHPQVYSIRSHDQPADKGVLPTDEERDRYHMNMVYPEGLGHNDMGNGGTAAQQAVVLGIIRAWLKE